MIVLLGWGCAATARPPGADCAHMTLSANDLSRIRISAKAVVQAPVDLKTLQTCRERHRDFFRVTFDTVGVPQADGTDRRQSVVCNSDYLRSAPWDCGVIVEYRGIRVVDSVNARSLRVVIPPDMDVALARERVGQAFSLLGQKGETASCGANEGMKTLPEITDVPPGVVKDFPTLHGELGEGDGELTLELDSDGFAVSHYPLNVHFVFGQPDGKPQVRCWSRTVILITD